MGNPLRLGLLISGGGTTANAINAACEFGGALHGKIQPAVVIASRSSAGGIAKAKSRGIPTVVVSPCQPAERFGEQILEICREFCVDLAGQYGWLPLTPPNVIAAFPRRIVNQHPAPPEFGGQGMHGKAPHCAVIAFQRYVGWRDPWTEAICQWVDPEYDKGAVIYRLTVPILPDDDVDPLQARVLPVEWLVQIQALELFAAGRVRELPPRARPLVRPGEEMLLETCKHIARELYPHG